MAGKIVLNLAMSLDGFISDINGGFDWIQGQENDTHQSENTYFDEFIKDIDIVVMGRRSYEEGFTAEFQDKKIYVATNQKIMDTEDILFIGGDIVKTIKKEKEDGNNIYLFGGGELIDNFIKKDIIDEYIIGIVPIILGNGRPMFLQNNPTIPLRLTNHRLDDGVMIFHYEKR